ncbi:DMT family transporter [Amycolatopsis sp.]|uniref:DMT family transporter n=1 Tax=Amycolatopsis sp. TaxID=37632 RepID=UPI002DF9CC01|nr:EamA family transporter [Amycolatopsis sp.]
MSSVAVVPATRNRSGLALILAGILWGTGGLSGSLLSAKAGLHPLSVATYRLLLGGAFAVLFLWLTGGLREFPRTRAAFRRLLVAGGLLGLFQASYFLAVSLSSVSIATMTTIGGAPVFVAVVTAVRERRVPGAATLVSIGVALVGLVLLRWSPDGASVDWRLIGGVVFALLAGAGFATLTLVTANQVDGLEPLRTTAFGCLIGGLVLLPVAGSLGLAMPFHADVLGLAVYLGLVPTALAYAAYFRGLVSAHPVLAALSALLEPLTAAMLSALVLHERLGVVGWCGAALLVGALAVSYWRPEPR